MEIGDLVGSEKLSEHDSGQLQVKWSDIDHLLARSVISDYSKLLASVQIPDYSKLLASVQIPDYSKLVRDVKLPDVSDLLANVPVADYADLLANIHLPDYSKLLASVQIPDYSKLLASVNLPDYAEFVEQIAAFLDEAAIRDEPSIQTEGTDLRPLVTGWTGLELLLAACVAEAHHAVTVGLVNAWTTAMLLLRLAAWAQDKSPELQGLLFIFGLVGIVQVLLALRRSIGGDNKEQ